MKTLSRTLNNSADLAKTLGSVPELQPLFVSAAPQMPGMPPMPGM